MTHRFSQFVSVCFFFLAATLSVTSVQAVPLAPGAFVALGGTTSALRPELAGVVLHDMLIPFEIYDGNTLLFKGNLQNRVALSNLDATLDFYYYVRDTQPGLNGILTSATTIDFSGFSTDVDYRIDGLGDKPTTRATRSLDGSSVDLIFGNSIFSGEDGRFTFLKTDATAYKPGGKTQLTLQTGQSVILDTMMPAVPEPSGILLAAGGLLAFLRRGGERVSRKVSAVS